MVFKKYVKSKKVNKIIDVQKILDIFQNCNIIIMISKNILKHKKYNLQRNRMFPVRKKKSPDIHFVGGDKRNGRSVDNNTTIWFFF